MHDSLNEILNQQEMEELRLFGKRESFDADQIVFEESMASDKLYLIEEGEVSIYIKKYLAIEEIKRLSSGQFLGEMGVVDNAPRTASAKAVEASVLLSIDKSSFDRFFKSHPQAAHKISMIIEARNAELTLKECVLGNTDFSADDFHVSMKGDPSLRETVFSRERYYSIVDEALDQLLPTLEDLLLNRNVFRFVIYFNSGEIRIHSVFDPFTPQIHAVNRLVSSSYVERHFPIMDWDEKVRVIGRIYELIANDKCISSLSDYWLDLFVSSHLEWKPVSKADICKTISEIQTLRNIEQYYLRNISISMVRDIIRMQFNCDGTHFVNSDDYQQFLKDNLI